MPPRLSTPTLDDPAFAARWREAAAHASPFLSWDWIGCQAGQRFTDPVLAEAGGGMALFNRRGRALFLHESGDPALDAVFTEHNGPLGAADAMPAILDAIRTKADRVVLSGIDDAGLHAVQAAGGIVTGLQTRAAPFAALERGTVHMERLSRNTRAQLRRSDRSYAESGAIVAERAEAVDQALEWFEHLVVLHRVSWTIRGQVSGFLSDPVLRFHRTLLSRGVPDGVVDMVRVTAGDRVIGYLLNLRWGGLNLRRGGLNLRGGGLNLRGGGRVCAYQSGFDYEGAAPREKPGLTCHHAAIEAARQEGLSEYDFLAGDSRYKRSLATGVRTMHWLTWKPRPAFFGIEAVLRRWLRR